MRLALLGLSCALAGCGADCTVDGLQGALDSAASGDVIEAGACRYEGAIRVPDGVVLRGRSGGTVLASASGDAVVLGDGAAIESLAIEVALGRGVVIDGVSSARVSAVRIEGPVDQENADALPPLPEQDETATHGIVVLSSSGVVLEDVAVSGFGRFGALFVDSDAAWRGGSANGNLGAGIMVQGGAVELSSLEICGTLRGLQPFAYGAVVRGGANVTTDALVVCDNDGVGLMHDGAIAHHVDLEATRNRDSGVWAQRNDSFTLEGATIEDNSLTGVVLVDNLDASIVETRIATTREATTVLVDRGEVRAGDGLHVIAPDASFTLRNLTLEGNGRVGLLLSIDDGVVPSSSLEGVVVEASGDSLGAIAQTESAMIAGEWDAGVERRGAAIENDAVVVDPLAVLGAVAPMFLPPSP